MSNESEPNSETQPSAESTGLSDHAEPTSSGTSKRKAEWFEIDEEKNTHVYVSCLPPHITEEEFVDLMKTYGIIAKRNDAGRSYNVKLYRNKDGSLKGDARCGYAFKESADRAIELLDGYLYEGKYELRCERAHFEIKGAYDPSRKPRLDKRAKLNKKKKLEKLLSWEPEVDKNARQKKVVLKNMFKPDEILEDAENLLFLKEDVETKCSNIQCEPKRVDVYDKHPEGVITIIFATHEQAEKCVQELNQTYYDKRIITAELWDGKTKYKIKETDEESQKRLEKWHEDIQKSDDEDIKNSPSNDPNHSEASGDTRAISAEDKDSDPS